MDLIVSSASSIDVGLEVGRMGMSFSDRLTPYAAKIDANVTFVFFASVTDPNVGSTPETTSFNRRDKSLYVWANIDHGMWKAAASKAKIGLFSECLLRCVDLIDDKHLSTQGKAELSEQIRSAQTQLMNEAGDGSAQLRGASLKQSSSFASVVESATIDDEAEIQVVLQWQATLEKTASGLGVVLHTGQRESALGVDLSSLEDFLESQSNGLYVVDGHDVGGGKVNIFLYTTDVAAAVKMLVDFAGQGSLPSGVRIAVGDTSNNDDRAYRQVYPDDGAAFEIL
ncbi:MAG: hypothetical protein H7Z38_17020 [Rubrivivax sp.]|nr:hypothetical protein [Pyrinomonadaceae bacterium]